MSPVWKNLSNICSPLECDVMHQEGNPIITKDSGENKKHTMSDNTCNQSRGREIRNTKENKTREEAESK